MPCYKKLLSKGERWFFKFDFHGITHFSKAIYLSKAEAKKAEAIEFNKADLKLRNPQSSEDITLLQAINERLDYVLTTKSKKYYLDNKRYLRALYGLKDVLLRDISKNDIIEHLLEVSSELQKQEKDNYKTNAMLRAFKALFNHAISGHDLNMKNPCNGIKFFPVIRRLKYIPPDKDIQAIMDICTDEQKRLLQFLMETGCRINEALKLTGSDIIEEFIVLTTRKSKNSDLVPRKLLLPECLIGLSYLPDQKIFAMWDEQPKFLERKQKKLGQRSWGFHSLRHRKASLWSKEGKPLYELMVLLGHKNLSTTQKYLQLL